MSPSLNLGIGDKVNHKNLSLVLAAGIATFAQTGLESPGAGQAVIREPAVQMAKPQYMEPLFQRVYKVVNSGPAAPCEVYDPYAGGLASQECHSVTKTVEYKDPLHEGNLEMKISSSTVHGKSVLILETKTKKRSENKYSINVYHLVDYFGSIEIAKHYSGLQVQDGARILVASPSAPLNPNSAMQNSKAYFADIARVESLLLKLTESARTIR